MTKCNALRNRLLPIVSIVAMTFAGSCSKDALMEPDGTSAALQTRATPTITITCFPDAQGEDKTYLGLKETYVFSAAERVIEPPFAYDQPCRVISVHNSDGSDKGVDLELTRGDLLNGTMHVKFTSPGYYHVTAQVEHDGAIYQQTRTYCVVSRAKSVTLPETIELGVPFDLKFLFEDTRYPAPTLEVTESLFNNPQYTVLSNDGHGSIRMRIDQPGEYGISTGLGGIFSACANIKLYWRPETLRRESVENWDLITQMVHWSNSIFLCNPNRETYTSLPYRVYFKYKIAGVDLEGDTIDDVSGEKFCAEGTEGIVLMPDTRKFIGDISGNWIFGKYQLYWRWHLTIPDDEIFWVRAMEPDITGPFEPGNPGGIIGPLDPPGGTIIK